MTAIGRGAGAVQRLGQAVERFRFVRAAHRAGWLREDRLVRIAAASAHRATFVVDGKAASVPLPGRVTLNSAQGVRRLVLQGDGTDEELLVDENVADMDLFIAVTSDDEDNILAAMLAKRLGARRVIALINRRAYADMLQGSTIDIAISPAHAVIGELLMHVRRGAVAAVHSLRGGTAEALEGVAHGDAKTSHLVGRPIEQIKLPAGARIGDQQRLARGTLGADAPRSGGNCVRHSYCSRYLRTMTSATMLSADISARSKPAARVVRT